MEHPTPWQNLCNHCCLSLTVLHAPATQQQQQQHLTQHPARWPWARAAPPSGMHASGPPPPPGAAASRRAPLQGTEPARRLQHSGCAAQVIGKAGTVLRQPQRTHLQAARAPAEESWQRAWDVLGQLQLASNWCDDVLSARNLERCGEQAKMSKLACASAGAAPGAEAAIVACSGSRGPGRAPAARGWRSGPGQARWPLQGTSATGRCLRSGVAAAPAPRFTCMARLLHRAPPSLLRMHRALPVLLWKRVSQQLPARLQRSAGWLLAWRGLPACCAR